MGVRAAGVHAVSSDSAHPGDSGHSRRRWGSGGPGCPAQPEPRAPASPTLPGTREMAPSRQPAASTHTWAGKGPNRPLAQTRPCRVDLPGLLTAGRGHSVLWETGKPRVRGARDPGRAPSWGHGCRGQGQPLTLLPWCHHDVLRQEPLLLRHLLKLLQGGLGGGIRAPTCGGGVVSRAGPQGVPGVGPGHHPPPGELGLTQGTAGGSKGPAPSPMSLAMRNTRPRRCFSQKKT